MNIRNICLEFYSRARSAITPNLKYSQTIYEEILRQHSPSSKYWLDLGCGQHLLPPWRTDQAKEMVRRAKLVIGLDGEFESLKKHKAIYHRIRGDISSLPFANDSFDLVTSNNMVFEQLRKLEIQLPKYSEFIPTSER